MAGGTYHNCNLAGNYCFWGDSPVASPLAQEGLTGLSSENLKKTDNLDGYEQSIAGPATHKVRERVKATAKKHWLVEGANPEQKAVVDELRRQYYVTASEYYKSALYI